MKMNRGYPTSLLTLLYAFLLQASLCVGVSQQATLEPATVPENVTLSQKPETHALKENGEAVWIWAVTAAALAAVLGIWAAKLHRTLKQQRQDALALREAHSRLEQRMAAATDEINKQTEDLRQSNLTLQQFKALADATTDYVGIAGLDAKMTYMNPAGRKMLGFGKDENLVGMSYERWATAEFIAMCNDYGIQKTMECGTWESDMNMRHQDGSLIPVSLVSIGIKADDGTPLFFGGIGRDIRARLAMEAELRASQASLTQALQHERELGDLKSRFVAMVSHEFRTPLGVIMSAVELMRHYDEKLDPAHRRELCNEIYDSTRGMADLMEQVLMLGRVEAGKLAYRPTPIDFDILVGKLIDESLSATKRKCHIRLESEPDLSNARGDEALLRHILGNLITNAVKYSPEGADVIVRLCKEGTDVVCVVEDHGIGIPEAELGRLFEVFHRCSNVGEIPGTGLGLVIVKRCVELHGGTIEVKSVLGEGTRFIVRLRVFDQPPTAV